MFPINNFDPDLRFMFKENEFKNLQSCMKNCNIQLKNEQKSWTTTISDNKIIIIALVACAAITRIALKYVVSSSMIVLPSIAVPVLYTMFKLDSLKDEANDRLAKTRKVFESVFSEYASPKNLKDPFSAINLQKREDCNVIFDDFLDSSKKISSLQTVKKIETIITKHGDTKGLGSLSKVVLIQMLKDQRRLDKITNYQRTCNWGAPSILFAAQRIDELIRPCLFLVSKSFNIAFITFTAVVIGGSAAYNYINHWKDQEIGKDIFRELLPELNGVLGIPKEFCGEEFFDVKKLYA
ncbi:MAG: hypothetical protein ACRCU0_05345 [Candidatus Rhabdochlamydia sp.]